MGGAAHGMSHICAGAFPLIVMACVFWGAAPFGGYVSCWCSSALDHVCLMANRLSASFWALEY